MKRDRSSWRNHMKFRKVDALAILMFVFLAVSSLLGAAQTQTQQAAPALPNTPVASLPKGMEKITSVEGITQYRLSNGLTVLLFPDPTKQTITVNMTYLVGSVKENYGETGMAHLLEHVLFLGSTKHPTPRQ